MLDLKQTLGALPPHECGCFSRASAETYMRLRTCIFSRSEVPRPFLLFGQSRTPDDFRTFFPEQDISSEQDTIFDTQNWLKPRNLQTKGVRSSYCDSALFSSPCSFALAEAAGFSLRRRLACALEGLFHMCEACNQRATV